MLLTADERDQRKTLLLKLEENLTEFKQTQFAFTNEYRKKILIDSAKQRIGVIDANRNFAKKYRFDQIRQAIILEDVSDSDGIINSIKIKLIVEDISFPDHIFEFSNGAVERNSLDYVNIMNRVNYWHDLLDNPIKNIKRKPKSIIPKSKVAKKNVVAQKSQNGCLAGCLTLVGILILIIILVTACVDTGSKYQPGDYDFDGDSGDFDDAVKFLQWKINVENK